MPPRVRKNGTAVGQRRVVGETMIICQCSECVSFQYFDTLMKELQQGQRIPLTLFKKHSQREKRRAIAFANYKVEADSEYAGVNEPPNIKESDATSPRMVRQAMRKRSVNRIFMKSPNPRIEIARKLKEANSLLGIASSREFKHCLDCDPLQFSKSPAESSDMPSGFDCKILELDPSATSNYQMIKHEHNLANILRLFDRLSGQRISRHQSLRIQQLRPLIEEERNFTYQLKKEIWERQRIIGVEEKGRKVDTSPYFVSLKDREPISCLVFLLAATLHFLANLSLADLRFILSSLALLLRLASEDSTNCNFPLIIPSIPSDVRTVIKSLPIEPKYKALVCCPSCFSTYDFDVDDLESYPEFCQYRSVLKGNQCRRRLRRQMAPNIILPEREYVFQDIRHWIARMYARHDIEEYLDRNLINSEAPGQLDDIWDGTVLQEFLGPDGRHFMDKPSAEGRLIFGLNMDGFNPYGNKAAGKQVTICGIYLVCFNLPIHLRYRTENICLVGIVPGPHEPSKHQVNHLLKPLVDDLLSLWHQGVYLSKTTKYPLGRAVRCALVPVICDLPAARRVAGLGGHSSDLFCSECLLPHSEINDLDRSNWRPRNRDDHVKYAKEWRDASTESARKEIFKQYGAKWSELLRLPYWDPTRFVVIDSMHGFYLRLFQRHVKDVWGMNVKLVDGNGVPVLDLTEEDIAEAQHVVQFGEAKDLKSLSKTQLQFLCREAELHYGGTKSTLLKLLLHHRVIQGWFREDGTRIQEMSDDTMDIEPAAAGVLPNGQTRMGEGFAPNLNSSSTTYELALESEHMDANMDAELNSSSKSELLSDRPGIVNALLKGYVPGVSASGSAVPNALSDNSECPTDEEELTAVPGLSVSGSAVLNVSSEKSECPTDEEELTALYRGTKDGIRKADRKKVIDLCVCKLNGERKEYERMSRNALNNLIFKSREDAGIIAKRGRPRHNRKVATIEDSQRLINLPSTDLAVHPTVLISLEEPSEPKSTLASFSAPLASNNQLASKFTPDITDRTVQKLDRMYQTGTKTALKSTSKYLLAVLCAMKFKQSVQHYEKQQKDDLLATIKDSRLQEGIIDEDEKLVANRSIEEFAVLGQETLREIRTDMEHISLPSWFTPAPKHPGEVKWGKFKADEWKAFCLVNLPITLTRLWGSRPETDRHYQMLENFMHLVTAVKIANKRRLTFDDIDLYETHMETYIAGFIKLYPFVDLSPYQHLALHFPAHLRRFGPTHSWRCFAFERYNGLIQGLPTNQKFGEMEKSKFLRFCRTQNLRALYSEANLPNELHPIISTFEKGFSTSVAGTRSEDTGFYAEPKVKRAGRRREARDRLDESSIKLFKQWMASNKPGIFNVFLDSQYSVFASVEVHGEKMETAGDGNSNVIFQRPGTDGAPVFAAGKIISLFSYIMPDTRKAEIFAVLRSYASPLERGSAIDIFRRLPTAAGFFLYDEFEDDPSLVPLSSVVCHFASKKTRIPEVDREFLQIVPIR